MPRVRERPASAARVPEPASGAGAPGPAVAAAPAPAAGLPAWLRTQGRPAYEPPRDRDGFLRDNLLRLVSLLEVFRGGGRGSCLVARTVGRVDPRLRLVGTVAVAALVSAARNMAFVWCALAVVLAGLVVRPARELAAIVRPALAAAALVAVVALPAALLGTPSAPVRMGAKTLVTTSLVLGLARSLGAHGLVEALRRLRLPATAALVLDLAVRDLALLGQVAGELSRALALRCVGRNRDKAGSAAGVLGTTFLKAHDLAAAQYEAMACRGFDGLATVPPARRRPGEAAASALYALALALAAAAFALLEGAMA